ncbi:glycosyltransferase [Arthrobacter sp. zg-Y453]|uniref:Glycosyltransferase n=1 Tax=Arthrobacter caoxuetaonis TaxID=2886935 RepID=A0A9X1SB40_9MICC|nr:glycosyltransferase family 2 protein [Arthrobacter caoxuetaonis]MCC3296788.1 glycosyltransferase [Arthrobacter caoxuetaonis]
MFSHPPLVSIVTPCYNAQKVLSRAVGSVRQQTMASWELILVNDRSTDGTAAAAQALASQDPRIRVLDLPENLGSSGARNAGIDAATGSYLVFLDADDEMLPGFLARLTSLMTADTDVVACGHFLVSPDGKVKQRSSKSKGMLLTGEAVRAGMTGALTPFPWDKLYRRELFEGLRYPEGAHRFEDMTMNVALYARSRAVKVCDEPLYRYYVSTGSLTWGRIPSTTDTETVKAHLEANLDSRYRTGAFAPAYAAMRVLMYLLVAQSAAISRDRNTGKRVLSDCRKQLTYGTVAQAARIAPVLAGGAGLLKLWPTAFAALYQRYAARSYGLG